MSIVSDIRFESEKANSDDNNLKWKIFVENLLTPSWESTDMLYGRKKF